MDNLSPALLAVELAVVPGLVALAWGVSQRHGAAWVWGLLVLPAFVSLSVGVAMGAAALLASVSSGSLVLVMVLLALVQIAPIVVTAWICAVIDGGRRRPATA
ncbi:MAG: hypothetical protein R2731_15395 [Nocardioides sp.]